VTSEARTRPRADESAPAEEAVGVAAPDAGPGADDTTQGESRRARRRRERAEASASDGAAAEREDDGPDDGDGGRRRTRRSGAFWVPVVAVLAVLLVLLLGAVGYLWFTRPAPSSVSTADYVPVLTQGRQDVVDLTSFDYQTIDQDIAQVSKISTGSLQKDSVDLLQKGRQQIVDQQAVVNTEVVSAAVTQAGDSTGRLMLVLQTTRRTKASATPAVSRYRIQADLKKVGDHWLLTAITGR